MVELEKVIETFNTEEGSDLVAEYLKRVFPKDGPEQPSDEGIQLATLKLMEAVSENATVPEGADCHEFLLEFLKSLINATKPVGEAKTEVEEIPPRPLPTGSPYLNPEEVNWLLKYDKKVKTSADYFVKWFRREHSDSCTLMKDEMIIETALDTLYKVNRRDPSIVSQLSGAGPSFFKQYEEGTPEEIVIRYLDSSSGRKESSSGTSSSGSKPKASGSSYSSDTHSSSKSSRKQELEKEKQKNTMYGIICLFIFWPAAIYFFYKASQIGKQIDSL